MKISNLSGIVPPVVTPLDEDKNLDRDSFKKVINRLIDAGVDGLFILGSTGSVVFLTNEQREEVIKTASKINDGRVPLLVGCIDSQTNRVIENIKIAEKYKVDAVVATAPFYALDCPEVVENHFRLLHKSTSLPIFAYDLPQCVGKKLDGKMLINLALDGALKGVKDSSGDDVSFRYLCIDNAEAGNPLKIFSGHEIVADGALLSGADGIVPGLGNVDPKVYIDMWKAYCSGDWKNMVKLQDRAAKLWKIVNCSDYPKGFSSGVGAFLTALKLMGIVKTNNVLDPSIPFNKSETARVYAILEEHGLV